MRKIYADCVMLSCRSKIKDRTKLVLSHVGAFRYDRFNS